MAIGRESQNLVSPSADKESLGLVIPAQIPSLGGLSDAKSYDFRLQQATRALLRLHEFPIYAILLFLAFSECFLQALSISLEAVLDWTLCR